MQKYVPLVSRKQNLTRRSVEHGTRALMRELIRRARRDGREAREMRKGEERGLRKGAIVSSSPQGMTSWNSSIKNWFFQAFRMHY